MFEHEARRMVYNTAMTDEKLQVLRTQNVVKIMFARGGRGCDAFSRTSEPCYF